MVEQVVDADVRVAVYRLFEQMGRAPVPAELARDLGSSQAAVEDALRRLAADHLLVLAPGTPYVWMANPLSALPTSYSVAARGRTWFANCIWDALGVIAMFGGDGVATTWCADCGDDLTVEVADDAVVAGSGVVHFALPAAQWWDDIGFN